MLSHACTCLLISALRYVLKNGCWQMTTVLNTAAPTTPTASLLYTILQPLYRTPLRVEERLLANDTLVLAAALKPRVQTLRVERVRTRLTRQRRQRQCLRM